jgi:hypothetical protein
MPSVYSQTKIKSPVISLLIYFLISIGVSLEIGGANWDIVWHGSKNVESFLTPPHAVIYTGVALTIASIIFRLILFSIVAVNETNWKLSVSNILKSQLIFPFSLKISIVGAILQLTAGPFDFWWHNTFGFDGLLSPPHSVLAIGMLLVGLGALTGIYKQCKTNSFSSHAGRICIAISFGVFLMVAVGLILMFTLPFSKGQYFNFNPEPFAAIFAAIVVIPFVMSLCLFSISSSTKIPFIFTSIVATIIAIQATATIISNSYFMGIFPFYILNILPAIVLDIILLKYRNHKNNNGNGNNAASAAIIHTDKRYLVASMLVSLFFITLFFPWTVDVFGGFFKPSNEVRTEQFLLQILFPVILPIVIPIALLSSFMGGYVVQRLHKKSQQN